MKDMLHKRSRWKNLLKSDKEFWRNKPENILLWSGGHLPHQWPTNCPTNLQIM